MLASSCPDYERMIGGSRAMERATRSALLIVFIRIYSLQLIPLLPAVQTEGRNHGNVLIHDRSNNIVYSARLVCVVRPRCLTKSLIHRFLIRLHAFRASHHLPLSNRVVRYYYYY